MSELNVYYHELMHDEYAEFYLKSEADNVIAEKDKTIVELKQKLEDVNEFIKESKELLKESQKMHQRCADGAIKKIRHNKYRRCLAMAYVEWLKQMILCCNPESIFYRRACRREHKWKELAEKFKEVK